MAWNLRLFPAYQNWVDARNSRIISFLWVGRRFKEPEFKIWVYFEQFLTQRARRWSSFIENFVNTLLEELKARHYIRQIWIVTVHDRAVVTDLVPNLDGGQAGMVHPKLRSPNFGVSSEYEVKAPLTLAALEEIVRIFTPYLDPE